MSGDDSMLMRSEDVRTTVVRCYGVGGLGKGEWWVEMVYEIYWWSTRCGLDVLKQTLSCRISNICISDLVLLVSANILEWVSTLQVFVLCH